MFASIIRLEFAKQRRAFLSGIFVAAIFLLFILAESLMRSRNVIEVLRDIMGYFALLGMPALLILTGPIAASQLRSDSIRNAEEPLPFSPAQKVFGAYLTSLFYLLIGSLLFTGGALALNSIKTVDLPLSPAFILLAILQIHLLAFLFTYWVNQAILGTALATLIVGIEIMSLLQAEILSHVFNPYTFSFSNSSWPVWTLTGVTAGLIGGIAGLLIISKRVELGSRTFFFPGLTTSLAVCMGIFVLISGMLVTSYNFQNKLYPSNWWFNYFVAPPKLENNGVFFRTVSNDLVRITPEKRETLIDTGFTLNPQSGPEIIDHEPGSGNADLFLLKGEHADESSTYEIWRSTSDKFERYTTFRSPQVRPTYLVDCKSQLCIYGFTDRPSQANSVAFAELSPDQSPNQTLEWKMIPISKDSGSIATIQEHHLQPDIQAGRLAMLSPNRRTLIRKVPDNKTIQWELPGEVAMARVLGSVIFPAYQKNGEPYFAIPVSENDRTTIVLCQPDGSITPVWNYSWESTEQLYRRRFAGGMGWIRWKEGPLELLFINSEGITYRFPISDIKGIDRTSWPAPIRIEGSLLWMFLDEQFLKIDLNNGKVLHNSGPLFKDWHYYSDETTKEGIYFVRGERICLIDWDGKIRDLGSATVN